MIFPINTNLRVTKGEKKLFTINEAGRWHTFLYIVVTLKLKKYAQ